MVERYRSKDYVGYKKPPIHARFKKGTSGNPSGRRRRHERVTVATMLAEQLQAIVSVTENGRPLKTDMLTLLIKQALIQGIKGNFRPIELLIKMLDNLERLMKTPTKKHPRTSPHDGIDIDKLTLDEKIKLLRETIANSKPLEEY